MFGTVLFGLQTVLSRAAMEMSIGPFTFNALVLVFGSIFLGLARKPLLRISQLGDEDVEEEEEVYQIEKKYFYFADTLRHYFPVSLSATDESLELLVWSVLFGLIHFCANTCTQIGLVTVQATTSGFITSLYVVFTPLLLAALTPLIGSPMGEINKATFVAAWISLIGSYVLLGCNTGDQTNCEASLSDGELITIIGAVLWAVSIIVSDLGVSHVNCIDLTFYGTIVCGIISLIAAFIMEYELMVSCVFSMQASSWLLCVSVGVVEVLAYALDLLGQMNTTGARAALLMSLDSVVTAIGAYFFLHESLSQIQFIGCLLMLTSTFVSSTQEKIHVLDETGRTTLTLVGKCICFAIKQFQLSLHIFFCKC